MMKKRVLLIEPYDVVADLLTDVLDQLDYVTDVVASGHIDEEELRAKAYRCVFINLDQKKAESRQSGLKLAAIATKLGVPVIMIPDHETADEIIAANGWLRIRKPFTIGNLEDTIAQAMRKTPATPD
jgi:DNA-binding NtrC family response regulator